MSSELTLDRFEDKSFKLTGVDRESEQFKNYHYYEVGEESQIIRFELNDIIYVAVEDNNDGYRSAMDKIFIDQTTKIKNKIPAHYVYAVRRDRGNDDTDVIDFF